MDDHEINRYIRSRVLTEAGFSVFEAANGAEALVKFEEVEPQLVLLDINLPDLSGFEVCRRIKTSAKPSTVVLHISATAIGIGAQTRGLEGGADGYLTEPVEPELLIAQVNSLLRLRNVEEQLQESEERFRTIFAEAPIGMLLFGPDLRVQQVNDSIALMLGSASGAELEGRSFADLLHPDWVVEDLEQIERLFAGVIQRYQAESAFRRLSGEILAVRLTVSLVRIRSGRPLYAIALAEDITQHKRDERALLRSYEEMSQFAYAASHDLQEPLRSIISHSQLLARRYGDQLDRDAQEILDHLLSGADRMKALITDLLTLSQVQSSGTELDPETDTRASLEAALESLQTSIEETGAEITIGELPPVHVASGWLVQLFQNLVGNAVKYRHPHTKLRIDVSAERRGGEWLFCVRDNGIGFEQEYAEQIFGVFMRLHGRDVPGTGIGLSLCKRIVERHGGRIWADGRPEEGATFWFTLPTYAERPAASTK